MGTSNTDAHGTGNDTDMSTPDFEHLYSDAIAEMLQAAPNEPENIPTLPELMNAIREGADGEQLLFPNFEAFFAWWDTFTAYDQMDEGFSADDHKPILKVAYQALSAEGCF